ncbi:MAG: hypothetical protein WAK93_06540 [Solirubrobacteraceae bacterium]
MPPENWTVSKDGLFKKLRFAGISEETIAQLDAVLPDPVDLNRYADTLGRYGLSRDELVSRRGGSP